MTTKVCRSCGLPFVVHEGKTQGQTRCPKCIDIHQHRPSVVTKREALAEFSAVRIDGLPDGWSEFLARDGDDPRFKIDTSGRRWGLSWAGRIVIFAPAPFEPGEVVVFRHMKATHQVRTRYLHRRRSDFKAGVNVSYSIREKLPFDSDEGEIEEEIHHYIALEPTALEPTHRLVWGTVDTKTTIKGFGAQYHGKIQAPEADWGMWIRGGVRSGRARTEGALLVLPLDAKITISQHGHSGSGKPEGYNWEKEI